jgi:hypothetical protein
MHNFVHGGEGADLVHVRGSRGIEPGILLSGDGDGALVAQGLNQLNGALPPYRKGQHGMREQDSIANWQNRDAPQTRSGFFRG